MEDVRKYMEMRLVTSFKKLSKLVASPWYEECRVFNDNLIAVKSVRKVVELNKPIYTGFSVLDLSKLLMYDFHYGYIKTMYGNNAELLFTDTDSLAYIIKTADIYADMLTNLHLFDTSEYPEDSPLHSTTNRKVIGKFKDECNGSPILEFVGFRAKMYSIRKQSGAVTSRAKGVQKSVVKKQITFDDYLNALRSRMEFKHLMTYFRSCNHIVSTVVQNKTSLSVNDDKRFILEDGIHTLAHGHYSIATIGVDVSEMLKCYLC
jgi:hypothetical protein